MVIDEQKYDVIFRKWKILVVAVGIDGTFRLDQSTKHTHTNLHTYAKTYQTIQGKHYISHQMANRPFD